ncbi:MAG: HupE/UreJ family protein [Gammaproteobacteria bacterium]|nr:HupE/UreJ family protein [Gammaproteobacteria bacterium]
MLLRNKISLFIILSLLGTSLAFGHGMSEAEKQAIIDGGNMSYLWLGATHMLTGYDHLLFVFGIIFFLTTFRDIVKYITAFTLGHSVTLILATFNGIQINYFLIDAIIGLSVCYIAFTNLDGFKKYLNVKAPNMLAMITGLGLIHGLGLSTRLQQLPLNDDQLLLNIITFNVGIELGQLIALALMLLALTGWRKTASFVMFSKLSNFVLIFAGVFLFSMQIHGYWHVTAPDDFGFSSDSHYHDHLRMNEEQARQQSNHQSID